MGTEQGQTADCPVRDVGAGEQHLPRQVERQGLPQAPAQTVAAEAKSR